VYHGGCVQDEVVNPLDVVLDEPVVLPVVFDVSMVEELEDELDEPVVYHGGRVQEEVVDETEVEVDGLVVLPVVLLVVLTVVLDDTVVEELDDELEELVIYQGGGVKDEVVDETGVEVGGPVGPPGVLDVSVDDELVEDLERVVCHGGWVQERVDRVDDQSQHIVSDHLWLHSSNPYPVGLVDDDVVGGLQNEGYKSV
jgi:hypothetical protein